MALTALIGCTTVDETPDAGGDVVAETSAVRVDSQAPAPTMNGAWQVSPAAIGPLRFGMTRAQARAAAPELEIREGQERGNCDFAMLPGTAGKLFFLVVDDRLMRVDVVTDTIATVEGARVGDTEARIEQLYGAQLSRQPHKYTDGAYLIVTPADTMTRIIFETDGAEVLRYRAGLLPVVQWVEGCS